MKLPGVGLHAFDKSLIPENLKELPRASRRLMEVLSKGSATPLEAASRSWSLDFCLSPKQFRPASTDSTRVGATTVERTDDTKEKDNAEPPPNSVQYFTAVPVQSVAPAGAKEKRKKAVDRDEEDAKMMADFLPMLEEYLRSTCSPSSRS